MTGNAHRIFALALAIALAVPASAHAQGGFFGAIMDMFGGRRGPPPPPPPQSASGANPFDFLGINPGNQSVPPATGGPHVAYCVRTCDGRYFPLSKTSGNGNTSPAKMCSSFCPTAETKIYSGNNIENAVAPDGSRYSSLKNAFLYREKLVEGCTCNGGDSTGNTKIDVKADPTLRPGDIVVTGKGPMVFKGGKGDTYKASDFAPAADSARLSGTMRDKVSNIKVAKPANAPLAGSQELPRGSQPASASVPPESKSTAVKAAEIFDFKDFNASGLRGSVAMGYNGQQ